MLRIHCWPKTIWDLGLVREDNGAKQGWVKALVPTSMCLVKLACAWWEQGGLGARLVEAIFPFLMKWL